MAVVDSSPAYVKFTVTSSLTGHGSQCRFASSTSVRELKGKLELITGATASLIRLQIFDADDKLVCELDNEEAILGSYPVQDGFRMHVINEDPSKSRGQFDDLSTVEKFELSADAYAKRDDSVMAFKKRMKLGRFSDKNPEEEAAAEEAERAETEAIKVGSRCEVSLKGVPARRGVVMYVGKTDFKPGYWIGVKYDEPVGKNNGCVQGKQYFECLPKYGGFAKAKFVKVGDFPEETFSDDDEM